MVSCRTGAERTLRKKTVRDGEQPDARSQLGHPSFSATKTRNGSGSKRERAARQHASESVIFPGYKLTAAPRDCRSLPLSQELEANERRFYRSHARTLRRLAQFDRTHQRRPRANSRPLVD